MHLRRALPGYNDDDELFIYGFLVLPTVRGYLGLTRNNDVAGLRIYFQFRQWRDDVGASIGSVFADDRICSEYRISTSLVLRRARIRRVVI